MQTANGVVREGDAVEWTVGLKAERGTVARIIRASNPQHPGAEAWVLEVLGHNQRVLLTPDRARELFVKDPVTHSRTGGSSAPMTVERKATVASHYSLPAGTEIVPTTSLRQTARASVEKLQGMVAHLSDPWAGRRARRFRSLRAVTARWMC